MGLPSVISTRRQACGRFCSEVVMGHDWTSSVIGGGRVNGGEVETGLFGAPRRVLV
jgi:hypothetical protein